MQFFGFGERRSAFVHVAAYGAMGFNGPTMMLDPAVDVGLRLLKFLSLGGREGPATARQDDAATPGTDNRALAAGDVTAIAVLQVLVLPVLLDARAGQKFGDLFLGHFL